MGAGGLQELQKRDMIWPLHQGAYSAADTRLTNEMHVVQAASGEARSGKIPGEVRECDIHLRDCECKRSQKRRAELSLWDLSSFVVT